MKNSRTLAIVVIVLLVVVGLYWFLTRRAQPNNVIDFVTDLTKAERRSNDREGPPGIVVTSVTIDGQAKRSILARPSSRLIYTVTVPRDGWFETSYALRPDAWSQPTDGAQFRVGVSDGHSYDELLRTVVDPRRGDKRWFTARLDLSAYEGRTVKVILNTDPGPPGHSNVAHDESVWGEPKIYSQR
jgi:hypothetical protein